MQNYKCNGKTKFSCFWPDIKTQHGRMRTYRKIESR